MLTKNDVVSIIVPIYNAENSLHHCIESILDQTYRNIEVILINDGSTDHSQYICDDYAILDQRIKVIHQENNGPSVARNKGIEHATGHYLQFVDADDHIEPMMTETLVKAMTENTQLVICGYQSIHFSALKKHIPSIHGIYQNADFMQYIGKLYKDILLPSPCNKLYDTTLINDYQLRFIVNVNVGEDLLFNLAYIKVCPVVHLIDVPLYNYVIRNENSLSRNFDKDFYANQRMLHEQVRTFLFEENYYFGENRYFLKIIYANSIINSLNNLFHPNSVLNSSERKEQIRKIISDVHTDQQRYFSENIQSRMIGKMIKNKSTLQIYLFFKMKNRLQMKMPFLFQFLRRKYSL